MHNECQQLCPYKTSCCGDHFYYMWLVPNLNCNYWRLAGFQLGWFILTACLVRAQLLAFVVHPALTLLRSVSNHICFLLPPSYNNFFLSNCLLLCFFCVFYVLLLFLRCWPRLCVSIFCIDWLIDWSGLLHIMGSNTIIFAIQKAWLVSP